MEYGEIGRCITNSECDKPNLADIVPPHSSHQFLQQYAKIVFAIFRSSPRHKWRVYSKPEAQTNIGTHAFNAYGCIFSNNSETVINLKLSFCNRSIKSSIALIVLV